jgi:hypothetical protein
VDDKTTGELRWEKPDARKGKEITEEYAAAAVWSGFSP